MVNSSSTNREWLLMRKPLTCNTSPQRMTVERQRRLIELSQCKILQLHCFTTEIAKPCTGQYTVYMSHVFYMSYMSYMSLRQPHYQDWAWLQLVEERQTQQERKLPCQVFQYNYACKACAWLARLATASPSLSKFWRSRSLWGMWSQILAKFGSQQKISQNHKTTNLLHVALLIKMNQNERFFLHLKSLTREWDQLAFAVFSHLQSAPPESLALAI